MDMGYFAFANRRRCEAPDGFAHAIEDWSLSDWMTALAGEVGEAANIIKKMNRFRDGITGNSADETLESLERALAAELADAFIYLDLLAQRAGIRLEDVVRDKFEATSRRIGYPALGVLGVTGGETDDRDDA